MQAVETPMQRMHNEKTAGMDGIHGELIKHGGIQQKKKLGVLTAKIQRAKNMPKEWNVSDFKKIHKKGDKKEYQKFTLKIYSGYS